MDFMLMLLFLISASLNVPYALRSKRFYLGELRNCKLDNQTINWYGTPHDTINRLRNWN